MILQSYCTLVNANGNFTPADIGNAIHSRSPALDLARDRYILRRFFYFFRKHFLWRPSTDILES